MKHEDEPVTPDELVLRLIWQSYYEPGTDPVIHPSAFRPRADETDGISVFRAACLTDPTDVLRVMAEEKRDLYAIALLSVAELQTMGLSVQPAKIELVPGHAVLPELNIVALGVEKQRWKAVQKQLAALATTNLIRRPSG